MTLRDLGYTSEIEKFRINQGLQEYEIGRVISEHRELYIVKTLTGEYDAKITGNMRFAARNRDQYPAVGDWVAITTKNDFATILNIAPRTSMLQRQAVNQSQGIQIIATNIDYAFLVMAVDRDFNINRLERYLTICHSSNVRPIILLTKVDLIEEFQIVEFKTKLENRIKNIPIVPISSLTNTGYEKLISMIEPGKTYCMLGSSGVGKSTLLNNLSGKPLMKTNSISQSTNKGRHVTSYRELIILDNGGILIDNPGMREVGVADTTGALDTTFGIIAELAQSCRFKDCTHTTEKGCSVITAVERREIDDASYKNYLKMDKEMAHFESTLDEKRKKDKDFGKMMKNYKKTERNQ